MFTKLRVLSHPHNRVLRKRIIADIAGKDATKRMLRINASQSVFDCVKGSEEWRLTITDVDHVGGPLDSEDMLLVNKREFDQVQHDRKILVDKHTDAIDVFGLTGAQITKVSLLERQVLPVETPAAVAVAESIVSLVRFCGNALLAFLNIFILCAIYGGIIMIIVALFSAIFMPLESLFYTSPPWCD